MPKLSGVNYEKTKIEVAAVVGFNDAHNIAYSKLQLASYFGITTQSLRNWFPVTPVRGSQPSEHPGGTSDEIKTPVKKRARSEDITEESFSNSSSPKRPMASVRQTPVRNGGRDGKKSKMMLEGEVSSPSTLSPPPRPLLTSPGQKTTQSRKRRNSQSGNLPGGMEPFVGLKLEAEEDIEV